MEQRSHIGGFYLFDFLRSLMKVEKIPIIIYLMIDSLFAFAGVTIIFATFFENGAGMTDKQAMLCLGVSILVYLIAITLSLSPAGEWVLRKKLKCQDIRVGCDPATESRLTLLFNEVYGRARKLNPSISSNIRLFIQNENAEPNAFAVGRRSICVSGGLLALPDDQIKAVLAHEFGHLANKDTDLNLVVNIANLFMNFLFLIGWAILIFYKIVCWILSIFAGMAGEAAYALTGKLFEFVFAIMSFALVRLVQYVWNIIGSLFIKLASRGAEYEADEFAYNLGYGDSLIAFFKTMPDSVHRGGIAGFGRLVRNTIEALATLSDTHPATWKRIEKLESYTSEKTTMDIISESIEDDFIELT